MQFVINGVELRNGGTLNFDGFSMKSFFSRYFNQVTQTTVQDELWTFIPDFSALWSGNSYSYALSGSSPYGYFRLYISGSNFRIALYTCSGCDLAAWRYSAWATASTNGTFSNISSAPGVGNAVFGNITLKTGTLAGGANKISIGTGTISFDVTNGFTGSSTTKWMYNGLTTSYLQTSGGKIRTYSVYQGGYAGTWVSLT